MKKLFKTIGISLTLLFALLSPGFVSAQHGLDQTADSAGLTKYGSDIQNIVGNVIGAGLSMIGVLFFILVVYGGILWMTARGNQDQITKGRNTIIAAAVGLIVVLASYAITNFVLTSVQEQAANTDGGQTQESVQTSQCQSDADCASGEVCTTQGVCAPAAGTVP